jgi:hypothetical protein
MGCRNNATHPLKGLDSSAGNELLDKVISQREIIQACENLKNGKSCGMDGILNEMIKYGQHALLHCLEKLFNTVKQFTQTTINSYTPIIIWI